MSGAGRWAPLILCLLQAAPGSPHLAPPLNVTLLSQNFSVYLTWLPGLGSLQNVTYFVSYQGSFTPRRWQKVEKCAGTRALVCSLMCLKKQDLYNKFKGRVQAVSGSARSPKVQSKYFDYLSEVEPAPPILVVTQMEKILGVNPTYQLPPCMPPLDLKYEVEFWKEGTGNKTLFPATPHGQPVYIPLQLTTSGRHCLRARTVYTFISPKYSDFSKSSCLVLEVPGASWVVLVLPLLLPLLVVAMGGMIWKRLQGNPWFQPARIPLALDFSGYRHPLATFRPSRPQILDDLFLHPQKKLTRRVRPAPQVRAPTTLAAESEDSLEDEDEDTDDSGSFQPYIFQPRFHGQEHHLAEHSEAEESGVHSGGIWMPTVPGKGSSAWDSSDRSWPNTVDSSPWDQARPSSYLTKTRPDQGPGRDRHQKPFPQLESSEDSDSLEEPLKGDLSWWATWGSPSPGRNLVPGEPPVSLQTFTFCWDSEENEGERGPEDSRATSCRAEYLPRTGVKGRLLEHYLAR
uniref:Interferon lambda receptor 1 n=1 Tax=Castor canadensis TaxID=51338 RepID=A0A8C0X6T0_CASCN